MKKLALIIVTLALLATPAVAQITPTGTPAPTKPRPSVTATPTPRSDCF